MSFRPSPMNLTMENARRFQPINEAQKAFINSTAPEVLYSGAFGAGKSFVGCYKGLILSTMYPGNVGLICRKVFADLRSTTLVTLFEEVLPEHVILDHNKSEKRITIRANPNEHEPNPRPSIIYYRGLDRAVGVGSMNLGWIFADEGIEFTEDDWTFLESRLRLNRVPFRQMFTATNPGAPAHWMHKRFYEEKPRDEAGRAVRLVVEANAYENPKNPPDYRRRLDRLTGIHRERYVLGRWVGGEGLIFGTFNPAKQIVPAFEIPGDWPRFRSIDFGTANPFTCQWWAVDPATNRKYLYREVYMSERTAEEHARQIAELSEGESYQFTVADHDAGDRLVLKRHGIPTIPARKDVAEGLQVAASMIGVPEDGEPEVYLFEDALVEEDPRMIEGNAPTCFSQEIGSYVWAKGAHGTIKDQPLKKWDHGCDAYRYFAMEYAYRYGDGTRPKLRYKKEAKRVGDGPKIPRARRSNLPKGLGGL